MAAWIGVEDRVALTRVVLLAEFSRWHFHPEMREATLSMIGCSLEATLLMIGCSSVRFSLNTESGIPK